MNKSAKLTDDKLLEEILEIQRCETADADCPVDYESDDPCPECRAKQILTLVKEHYKDCVRLAEDQSFPKYWFEWDTDKSTIQHNLPDELADYLKSQGFRKIEGGRE